jgi:hypothetical protein
MSDHTSRKPSIVLDAVFAAILGSVVVATLRSGFRVGPLEPGPAAILTGVYVQCWGVLFILSYYFPQGSYLLKGLMWSCEHWGTPRGKWTAILWGVFALALGGIALLGGLGWILI